MQNTPNYYGIMPASVRYNNALSSSEKILFVEITALSNAYGYCNATNGYFARLYEVTPQTVSGWVRSLKDQGLVGAEDIDRDDGSSERRLTPIMENLNTPSGKDEAPLKEKINPPIKENLNHNNTSSNTTSNNSESIDYMKFLDKWNEVNDAQCRMTSKKRTQIRARLQAYSADELMQAMKYRSEDDWINGDGKKFKANWDSFWRNDEKPERYLMRGKMEQEDDNNANSLYQTI